MNKKELTLLVLINAEGADDEISALTIAEMTQLDGLADIKANTVYKIASGLSAQGYLSNGLMDGRAKTYYITPSGKELIKRYEG